MRELVMKTELSQEFSLVYQQRIGRTWDKRLSNSLAFVPHELQGKVTPKEAYDENMKLGNFASNYMKRILPPATLEDKSRRISVGKAVLAVGYGLGYDSKWLKEATLANLVVWWVDASGVACQLAAKDLKAQWKKTSGEIYPIVRQGEIRSILAKPDSIDLNISLVEVWYLCRVIGCLSKRSAKIVLQQLGSASLQKDRDPNNKIVIITATRDRNPNRVARTSRLYSVNSILANVRRGAERSVEVVDEATTTYFDQIYSGMIIQGKNGG